jgi:hypothetical protein
MFLPSPATWLEDILTVLEPSPATSFAGQSRELAFRVNVSGLVHALANVKWFPFVCVCLIGTCGARSPSRPALNATNPSCRWHPIKEILGSPHELEVSKTRNERWLGPAPVRWVTPDPSDHFLCSNVDGHMAERPGQRSWVSASRLHGSSFLTVSPVCGEERLNEILTATATWPSAYTRPGQRDFRETQLHKRQSLIPGNHANGADRAEEASMWSLARSGLHLSETMNRSWNEHILLLLLVLIFIVLFLVISKRRATQPLVLRVEVWAKSRSKRNYEQNQQMRSMRHMSALFPWPRVLDREPVM